MSHLKLPTRLRRFRHWVPEATSTQPTERFEVWVAEGAETMTCMCKFSILHDAEEEAKHYRTWGYRAEVFDTTTGKTYVVR